MQLEALIKNLEGKAEIVLRTYLTDAQMAESIAKRELYVLRQRLANLGTDAVVEEEKLLSEAKQMVTDLIAYVEAIKVKLGGTPSNPVTPMTKDTAPSQPEVEDAK